MSKFRRGNFVFLAWKGDHGPRHVHVYKDSKLVVKWDLDRGIAMKGSAPKRLRDLVRELQNEGVL